jgi:hypothetical protein
MKLIQDYLNKIQESISAGDINVGIDSPHTIPKKKTKKKLHKLFLQQELNKCKNKQ